MGGSFSAIRPESGGALPSLGPTPTGSPYRSPKEEPGVPLPPGLIMDSMASSWEYRYTPEPPGTPAPIPTTPSILHQPLGLTPPC